MEDPANPSDRSLIVVSYCHDDERWLDLILSHIKSREAGLEIVKDRVLGTEEFQALSSATLEALEKAQVLVVLLSESYLRSSWIARSDNSEALAPAISHGLVILPVIIHRYPLLDIPLFKQREPQPLNEVPLADSDDETQRFVLDTLVTRIIEIIRVSKGSKEEQQESTKSREPTVDDLSRFSFEPDAERAVRLARALATTARTSKRLTTETLFFGLVEAGRNAASYEVTAKFLFNYLTRNDEELYRKEFTSRFPSQPYPSGGEIVPLDSIVARTTSLSTHASTFSN
jgi:hypothetical protein